MTRSPATQTALTVLVIVGLVLLLALVPSRQVPQSHGSAVQALDAGTTRSLFDRATPPVPEGRPEPNLPRTIEDLHTLDERGDRCAEGMRRVLVLFHGDAVASVRPVDEVVQLPGTMEMPLVPGLRTRGLPLGVLLAERPGAETIEIWPCYGDPLEIATKDIRREPERWMLLRTPRVFLKLVDRKAHGRRPIVRNVAAIRLVP